MFKVELVSSPSFSLLLGRAPGSIQVYGVEMIRTISWFNGAVHSYFSPGTDFSSPVKLY